MVNFSTGFLASAKVLGNIFLLLILIPVKNLKMEKSEHESRRQNKGSKKISIQTMVLKSKNTNLDVLVDKKYLLDSIPSSDFSIIRFFTGSSF
eukprot:Pgem_evm1s17669